MKPSDCQIGGNHYKDFAIQPAEFIQRNNIDWLSGNIIKYACRHAAKHGADDVRKIIHYAQLLLEWQYGEPSDFYSDSPPGDSQSSSEDISSGTGDSPDDRSSPDTGIYGGVCGLYRDMPGFARPDCDDESTLDGGVTR